MSMIGKEYLTYCFYFCNLNHSTMTIGKEETRKGYFERINKVIGYINLHLGEELDMKQLAQLGNYSDFHFQRIMRAYLGEPLGAYIIRIRLESSAQLLRLTNLPVQEIAMKVGYENPTSFNKAFKKRFTISPLEFRETINISYQHIKNEKKMNIKDQLTIEPKIKNIEPISVIYTQSLGPYGESASKAWETVCTYASEKKLFGFKTQFIGISHDDPTITDEAKLRYDACIAIRKEIKPEGAIGFKVIPGGKCAIFRHKGSYDKLIDSYGFIFGTWMPESGNEPDDRPGFEIYINDPEKTKPEKLQTDIYIPIK